MGAQSHPSTLSLRCFYYHDLTTRLRLLQHTRATSGDLLSGRFCGYKVPVFVLISVWTIVWYRTHSLLRDQRVSGSIDPRQKSNREGRLIGIDSDTNPRGVVPQSAR